MEHADGIDLDIVEDVMAKQDLKDAILTLEVSLGTLKNVMGRMSASEMQRHTLRLNELTKITDSVVENQKRKSDA